MQEPRYYVTTSIPYVNARPHIGHALELVQADVLARYHRLRGDDTRFLTGTDDNALTNVRAADAAGVPTQVLVDRNAARFQTLQHVLDLSNDDFIRTSREERHLRGVQRLWQACDRAGDIYRRHYQGLYCVGCERFYAEDELVAGLCPQHHTPPEVVAEENYFFRLSRYTNQLLHLIESNTLRIVPHTRRNEVVSFIRRGLDDFSISRSQARARGWGVPVPGDPDQVMYVWFDALGNYITALGYASAANLYHRYWLDNPRRVHVIGKDIVRFHAVYWPAILLSAGEPVPTTIYVHEFLTVNGERISKSLGTAIDPVPITDHVGTDAVRYWLLREMPRTDDGDFSYERLLHRYHQDLSNDLGNLLNRTVSMITRYHGGLVPEPDSASSVNNPLRAVAERIPVDTAGDLDRFDFRAALGAAWNLVTRANQYVEETRPWTLAAQANGGDPNAMRRLDTVLYNLAESLRLLAFHLSPYVPATSAKIKWQLGISGEIPRPYSHAVKWGGLAPGTRVSQPQPIFPRIPAATGTADQQFGCT